MNANRQLKINTGNRAKSSEKLSSGYRINRSADDAAGLAISEKLRSQVRGLDRGTKNAQDGVSWVQTADGALEEVHALLQRMRELTIQSLNDTNTAADRAACQAEFDALQSEIDRISGTTQFNSQNIFDEHELPYYQCEGNVSWLQSQPHVVSSGKNDLTITYREEATGAQKTASFTVPAGTYTTQELIDEMEDAIHAAGLDEEGIVFEFTEYGTCNLNLEGGEVIDVVGGGLSYLLYDMYTGGGFGALVGTTIFTDEYVTLEIETGENDTIAFDIEGFDGSTDHVELTIPKGDYTKQELIDYLNNNLSGKGVTATDYGTGIKLAADDGIVTGFKGNMFKIDDSGTIYHSVFYDNVKYGSISMSAASFTGGAVRPTMASSEEYANYTIDSTNNQLTFQPNGADTPETLTIAEGTYTPSEMVTLLNDFFTDKRLELAAELYSSGNYVGIKITSLVEGVTSNVGIDASSSAYNTLFVNREYNNISTATYYKEGNANTAATVTGAKEFTGSNLPLTVTSGVNDTFTLTIKDESGSSAVEKTFQITVDPISYSSAEELKNNINQKLNAAMGTDAGKVVAVVVNNKIQLQTVAGNGITSVKVSAAQNADGSDNTGYNDIFVKRQVTYTYDSVGGNGTSTTPPSVTLTDIDLTGQTFDSTNNTLDITVNGTTHTVTFPTGTLTQDQIIQEIENQIPEEREMVDNTFTSVTAYGTTDDDTINTSNLGKTNPTSKTYSAEGSSTVVEGKPGVYDNNKAATTTIAYPVPAVMAITDDCNQIQLNFTKGGVAQNITLTNGVYTPSALVNELQKQIDAAFGTEYGGGVVSLDSSGKLVITARLNRGTGQGDGAKTVVECATGTSSFLKKLHTTETAATISTGDATLQDSITIDDTSNTLNFTYKDGTTGGNKDVSLKLTNGTYDRAGIVAEINKQLTAGGHDVTATLSGNSLCLTTNDVGNDTYIEYRAATGGTSVKALYGEMVKKTAASRTVPLDLQDSITIDSSCNQFKISANGTTYTLTLDNKDSYTKAEFVEMLNQKLTDANTGLTAELDGNRIKYTTTEAGADKYFTVTYDASANSAMRAMYGQTEKIYPGVDASFDANGDLVLTSTQNGGSISVKPVAGSPILAPTESVTMIQPSSKTGYTSKNHSYIQGKPLTATSGNLAIDQWNDDLKFTYYDDGTEKAVNITVTQKSDYTYTELETFLQQEIDNQVGSGELTVTVDANGVRIETVATGNQNYLKNDFSGGFYYKVLCKATAGTSTQTPKKTNGAQNNDLAYTIGRKSIRGAEILIRDGINDTLSLDFTYDNKTITLSMELDAGTYSSDQLVLALQEKLNEQLVDVGLEAGTIEVGIGGVNSGVSGSNDDNALVFKLSSSVRLPSEGTYIIDGVSGNAAFSIFYQTDGELEPAYIGGSKDITQGVTVKPGETDLSFLVDGTDRYTIQLTEGDYTAEEIINELNTKLQGVSAPVIAEAYNNTVRLVYVTMGEHSITEISGGAKEEVFLQENGEKGDRTGVMIQLSSQQGNDLEIDRPLVSTSYLGINSIAITRPKYANKALTRLDEAISRVSEIRSAYGSTQNRLEHSVTNNMNTSENTQAAESRLRDTDMAAEMVKNAKYNILQQVTESMMAQGKVSAEGVLRLLQI